MILSNEKVRPMVNMAQHHLGIACGIEPFIFLGKISLGPA